MSIEDDFLKHFANHGLPMMQKSAFCITILGKNPDPKICLEMGAAVLPDKPIVIAVIRGAHVPANVRRVASAIVELDEGTEMSQAAQDKLFQAIRQVTENDARVRKPQ